MPIYGKMITTFLYSPEANQQGTISAFAQSTSETRENPKSRMGAESPDNIHRNIHSFFKGNMKNELNNSIFYHKDE